jgi:hypothetical protein
VPCVGSVVPSSVWSALRRRAHGAGSVRQVKRVAVVYLEETNLIKPSLVFLAAALRGFELDLPAYYFSCTKEHHASKTARQNCRRQSVVCFSIRRPSCSEPWRRALAERGCRGREGHRRHARG